LFHYITSLTNEVYKFSLNIAQILSISKTETISLQNNQVYSIINMKKKRQTDVATVSPLLEMG